MDHKTRFQAAQARLSSGDALGALTEFDILAKVLPNAADVAIMQGQAARRARLFDRAVDSYHRALSLKPDATDLLSALAEVQALAGDSKSALASYDQLARLQPGQIKWLADKALLLQQIGDFDQAGRVLRKALKARPGDAELFRMLAQTERFKPADPLLKRMQALAADPATPDAAKVQLGYALAKVMGDLKRHEKVFPYLRLANTRERKAFPFDFEAMRRDADALKAAQEDVTYPSVPDRAEVYPIFIVGTPRSGTTLVERILGAHPKVAMAGETGLATRGVTVLLGKPGAYAPLKDVPTDRIKGYGDAYLRHIRRLADVTHAVTDKSMMTHLILGVIRVTLPQARVIVVHRDPRDIAVSIYRNKFADGMHRYGNDLGDIARFIHLFRRSIDIWQTRLPEPIYTLDYEALVGDPEAQSRALVAAAGLDWDPACLAPHESRGAVKTLSLHQVRQPIYKTSARGWTRYADDLKPFDAVWEDLNAAG